ncbi:MAG: peptide deformylase [Brevinema sp.]
MAIKPIVSYGHPALRLPAEEVTEINDEILQIIEDLKDTLKDIGGLGLAAPQIGISKQIFIADLSVMREPRYAHQKVVFINPKITFTSKKTDIDQEGCLSFPKVRGLVERPIKIKMTGLIPSGSTRTIETTGLFARCLQHEYDHLHGTLFIDHFNEHDTKISKSFVEELLAENKKNLPEIME